MRIELIKFLAAGGSSFALELLMLWGLTELGGINYLWSAAAAFSIAVAVNYVMCIRWVWRSARRSKSTAAIFLLTSVAGLGINQLCMYSLVELGGLHYMLAKIVSTALVTVWNFFTKRLALNR